MPARAGRAQRPAARPGGRAACRSHVGAGAGAGWPSTPCSRRWRTRAAASVVAMSSRTLRSPGRLNSCPGVRLARRSLAEKLLPASARSRAVMTGSPERRGEGGRDRVAGGAQRRAEQRSAASACDPHSGIPAYARSTAGADWLNGSPSSISCSGTANGRPSPSDDEVLAAAWLRSLLLLAQRYACAATAL